MKKLLNGLDAGISSLIVAGLSLQLAQYEPDSILWLPGCVFFLIVGIRECIVGYRK